MRENLKTEPTAAALISSGRRESEPDRGLAARYAPVLKFDEREPFLPSAAGYTVFHKSATSPSFPRRIELTERGKPEAAMAIEYAIWWDWDIQHLYELEHAWVYVDNRGQVVRAEASWHGGYRDMAVDGVIPLTGDKLTIFSESGKHAFAPVRDWLNDRYPETIRSCARFAGRGGLLLTPLFKDLLGIKTPQVDRLVHTYLERLSFEPTMEFTRQYPVSLEVLVPWPDLFRWIPERLAWWAAELKRTIPPEERRFLRIAHRGASAYAPENTLAAIAKAAELGADMVELDLHTSADGVAVIIHDSDLSRSTNGHGMVSSRTLRQLKQLDAGNGETIPTLQEAAECCREHDLGLYLELKSDSAAPAVVELIRQRKLYHSAIVTSFQHDLLAQVKKEAPEVVTSVLFGTVNIDAVALARAVGAEYVHPAWENQAPEPHRLLTPQWIAEIRGAGLGIICWHEERSSEIAALRGLGVDGICSNAPDRLLPE